MVGGVGVGKGDVGVVEKGGGIGKVATGQRR